MNHIRIFETLTEEQKEQFTEIMVDGFGHLLSFTKDTDVLHALFQGSFHPSLMKAYIEQEKVMGLLGVATNKVRPIKFNRDVCITLFGKMRGNIICKQMNAIFQSPVVKEDNDLYIDVLATAKEARGKGVASKLIQYSFDMPQYDNFYIEVLSKNENAKRLYEKVGFVAYKGSKLSPIALQGYGYPIKMKRA